MRRLLREPLVHFLILGALLFVLYNSLDKGPGAPDEIFVSRGQVASLQSQFSKVWQREPNASELQALVDSWVREEALYRQGKAMGLDQGDAVVRRRVVQKVEFFAEGATPQVPTDAELQEWLDSHADTYRIEPRYSFDQVYFDPSRRGTQLPADVSAAHKALLSGQAVSGDTTMLPASVDDMSASEIGRVFGNRFVDGLANLKQDEWSEPIRSGFGLHLVRIVGLEQDRAATLAEVRQAVERDLLHDRTQKGNEAFYQKVLENYTVRVESTEEVTTPAPNTP
ncbi:peptidyl-prolyl cis-trans isomerase [Dokdonella sp.]|uniref:peptidylprolyl isomerase n=1 Tax=Dokdonella sp. TaxID=2291710 RepID=UPI003C645120